MNNITANSHQNSLIKRQQFSSERQLETIRTIRSLLTDLVEISATQSLSEIDLTVLKDTLNALSDPFLVVVVGEFNSGKSTLINVLVGAEVTQVGVTPTTAMVYLIRYGDTLQRTALAKWGELVTVPCERLRNMSIVDTPGTNSVFTDHEILTQRFYPRADFVFFITSADRPYTESERKFLSSIRAWGKKIVVLINKIDLIETDDERNKLVSFVDERIRHDFNLDLPVFPISARLAKKAIASDDDVERARLIEASGFNALEAFIQEELTDETRFRLKMESALGLGTKIAHILRERVEREIAIFQEDLDLITSIEALADGYERDLNKEIVRTITDIRNIFREIRSSADAYFDELFKVKHIPTIVRKEKVQSEFQDQVLRNLPVEIERKTTELVGEIYQRQSSITQVIADRIRQREDGTTVLADESVSLSERNVVLKRMQEAIDEVNDQLDREVATEIGLKHVQTAVKTALAIEVSAVGIGAALTIVATTLATDLLGIVAALWIGIAGFAVLPYYRKKSQREFAQQLAQVEENLTRSLETNLRDEVTGVTRRMKRMVEPLRAFDSTKIELELKVKERIDTVAERLEDVGRNSL